MTLREAQELSQMRETAQRWLGQLSDTGEPPHLRDVHGELHLFVLFVGSALGFPSPSGWLAFMPEDERLRCVRSGPWSRIVQRNLLTRVAHDPDLARAIESVWLLSEDRRGVQRLIGPFIADIADEVVPPEVTVEVPQGLNVVPLNA